MILTRDQCYNFFYFSEKLIWQEIGVFDLNKMYFLAEKVIKTLVFEKNAIFSLKISQIAENCDHNIGPREAVLIFIYQGNFLGQ
jgi:hypothetical protein